MRTRGEHGCLRATARGLGRDQPCRLLVLAFPPPCVRQGQFLLFKPPRSMALCYCSPSELTHAV